MTTLTQRFSTAVAKGFQAMPYYSTTVGTVPSGVEKRNQNRSNPGRRWTATPGGKDQSVTEEISIYFHACAGRANDFPFKDFTDYSVLSGSGAVVLITSGSYQLYKQYSVGGVTRLRKIVRPLSVVVAGGGTYSVSATTGVLTHSGGAAPTGWVGEFDCLCRFDTDEISFSAIAPGRGGGYIYDWGNLSFREVPL